MKKLYTLLLTLAMAFTLALPARADVVLPGQILLLHPLLFILPLAAVAAAIVLLVRWARNRKK